MAFMMGALAATPLFAQDVSDSTNYNKDNYNQVLGNFDYKNLYGELSKSIKGDVNDSSKKRFAMLAALGLAATVDPNLGTTLVTAAATEVATALATAPVLATNPGIQFVNKYEKATDKDAFLKKEFSRLEYKGPEKYDANFPELVEAIRGYTAAENDEQAAQYLQAFRNEYDNAYAGRRNIVMQTVLSYFECKDAETNVK